MDAVRRPFLYPETTLPSTAKHDTPTALDHQAFPDNARYCRNGCSPLLRTAGCWSPETCISTFNVPQNASIGPLSMQRPTRDILCVMSCASSFARNSLFVYWNPRSLWNNGFASGYLCTAASNVSNTRGLLLLKPIQ